MDNKEALAKARSVIAQKRLNGTHYARLTIAERADIAEEKARALRAHANEIARKRAAKAQRILDASKAGKARPAPASASDDRMARLEALVLKIASDLGVK